MNFEKQIQACRDPLGESAFLAALEKGRTMSMEQVIVFAQEEKTSL